MEQLAIKTIEIKNVNKFFMNFLIIYLILSHLKKW